MPFVLAACLAIGQITPQVQTDLRWHPRQNDQLKYALQLDLQTDAGNFRIQCDLFSSVVRVDRSGDYEVETAARNRRVSIDGGRQTLPDEAPFRESYSASGSRRSAPRDASTVNPLAVLDQVTELSLPTKAVTEGASWTNTLAADAKKGIVGATVKCQLVKRLTVNGFPAWSVTFQYRQSKRNGVEADGTFCASTVDGALVSFEANVRNLVLGSELPSGDATLTMKRVSAS